MSKPKSAQVSHAPKTRKEAEAILRDLGECQRAMADIEADNNHIVAALAQDHEERLQPFRQKAADMLAALQVWAEANREELLADGDGKTVKLASGEIRWRLTPPSVKITKPEDVIERLMDAGLQQYLRTSVEIDKHAILAQPGGVQGIKGIKVGQREIFEAKPFGAESAKVGGAR